MKHLHLEIDDQLKLVPIEMKFAKQIFESFDSEIITFLAIEKAPEKIEDTITFIDHSVKQIAKGHDYVWVILCDDQFTGCCGIHDIPSRVPHFGLWIRKDSQGKGIGKKVVPFMMEWGISNLDIQYLKYPVDKRNIRSIRLIEPLNLKIWAQYEMGENKKLYVDEYRLLKESDNSAKT